MRLFKKKSWLQKFVDRLYKSGPAVMVTWASAKFLAGLGIGVLIASYFPNAPNDGWASWGWALVLLAFVMGLPTLKAIFKN
ncbi:MAG: hypothetical protein ABIH90_03105 [Candidatus Aenigmatarchaeota archaeon]